MSPMRIWSGLAVVALVVLNVFVGIVHDAAHIVVLPECVASILRLGLSAGIMVFISAYCRDGIIAHINIKYADLTTAIDEYGDTKANEGRLDALRVMRQGVRGVHLVDK